MAATAPQDDRATRLRAAWLELKSQRKVRQRDAADLLEVSEAELLASGGGAGVTRLAGDLRAVLRRVPELGRVMALTRNDSCVHEKTGVYENLEADSMVGLALGEDIDLRLFFAHWKHGFAVTEPGAHGPMKSLQFYDAAGQAVHKIFLKDGADVAAYERLVADFAASDPRPGLAVKPRAAAKHERPDHAIDAAGLRTTWANLQDTHEFFGMLRKFDVTRTQGLRLAGNDFAYPAPPDAARRLLDDVALTGLPIMVFVGNPGCIQIHTGPVRNLKPIDRWLNVLDPGFNLHLRADRIESGWVVKKPTLDGTVTSLELFDAAGETIAMLFGKRKPGSPEMPEWQATVERLFPRRGVRTVKAWRLSTAAIALATASVALAQGPSRVVAVGGAVTEIVYALGAGDRLVAVDSTSIFPEAATRLPRVGYMRALSSEGVLAMHPQALIATAEAGPSIALAQIRSTGVPVTTVPSDHSLDTLRTRVRTVATALGVEPRGAELEKRILVQWREAERAVAGYASRPKVLFLLAHTGNTALVAGEDTAADAMIRYAGATNALSGFKGYKPLTAEAAIAAAPDVVLITTEGLQTIGGADRLWSRPGLALTPAGTAKRVVALDALFLLGFGPRLPEAVKDLARRLHGS